MKMKLYNTLFLLTVLGIFLTGCSADENSKSGYIFTCPRSLKLGSFNELQLLRFGNLDEGQLKVRLYYAENYNGNETLAFEKEFDIKEGEKNSFMKLFVDNFDGQYIYNGRIEVNGTIGDQEIGGSDKVSFSTPKSNIILIQTDKPLYKPGQEVLFRVLKLNKELKPSKSENDVADVFVEDPKGTRLFQFQGIQLGQGIKQNQFPLSYEPVLGSWKITVVSKNDTETLNFDVKEYVLPKFDVKIKFPSFVLANADVFPVEICAKYTYGKNVVGILNVNSSLETYTWSREKNPVLQESVKLNGCYKYTLNASLIQPGVGYRYRRIMVTANVIEEGTGIQRNATEYLQRQYSPYNLNFNTDQNQREYYRPGLPYNGKLKVTNPDDTPAEGVDIQLCSTIHRERVISQWAASRKVKICSNFTSDEKGMIWYTIPPQNIDSTSIYLEATGNKNAKYQNQPGTENNILNTPQAGLNLSPYFSPSGSFIQLESVGHPMPCGKQKSIHFFFTSKENADFKFHFQVVRQGEVVQSGTMDTSFAVGDDISDHFKGDKQLIDDSEEQIVPPPLPKTDSSSSSSSEEDCPAAKESKYVPPIGEAKITIDVDSSLSPSFNLLIFYVRDDKETVADSHKYEVEKCFKNKVEFEFGDEVKQPGAKTSVRVTASPDSLCGLKIVDKSISLLDSGDQLSKERVYQLIEAMDTNLYYSTNPCNEKIPQPGFYASSKTSIIRPPIPPTYSSSSYQDSLAAFLDSGFLVISNLVIFTRPCANGGGYGIRPVYQAENFASAGAGGSGPAIAMASTARRPPPSPSADAKVGVVSTKSVVEIRDYFPETWLFEMEMIGPDGVYVDKKKLPHTITEWIGSAVCVNPTDGLGISNATSIKGFQAFFISYTLPISAIRGEQFWIVVSIFSYADAALPVTVTLDQPEGFEVTSDSINGDICVQPDTSENFRIRLKGTSVGKVNITVRAETAASSEVCGSSAVSNSIAKDAITQPLSVEAEGFPAETVQSTLFCPTDEENQEFTATNSLSLPDDVVPDSSRAIVDVTGNVMGPAIKNLNNLVALPTGCGEQNMVKFTPNYLVLDYLTDIGKLTDSIKNKAIRNLNTGYQRELTYRHSDGSFSAFGEVDREGSMFLTAFVLSSFYEAKRYINIDNNVLTQAQNFIASKQQPDGCFPNMGRIIDYQIQGGLEKEKNSAAITAYVLAALIKTRYENETVINDAKACLKEATPLSPYETFLYAYTDALGGDTEAAKGRLADIKPRANTTNGVEFYKNPNGTNALDLETAAYAVLTNLQLGNGASAALPIVRYMTENLNPRGGFFSTQDTCVGLDAFGQFAKLVYQDPVDILVTLSGALDEKVEITEDNKLLVQRQTATTIPGELQVAATGSGCGLIQMSLRYNTNSPPQMKKFFLEIVGRCVDTGCKKKKLTTSVSYIPVGKAAGMSVIEIKMITGIVPVKDSLQQMIADNSKQILRFDVEDNQVNLYLSQVTNKVIQFSFEVEEVVEVENAQPGTGKVYDYYVPEDSATTSYTFGNQEPEKAPVEHQDV